MSSLTNGLIAIFLVLGSFSSKSEAASSARSVNFPEQCLAHFVSPNSLTATACSLISNKLGVQCVQSLRGDVSTTQIAQCANMDDRLSLKCVQNFQNLNAKGIGACILIDTKAGLDCVLTGQITNASQITLCSLE
ncbi:MAG: hypothetical protein EOP06_03840 [Proteobacteria bacterium]|nr:MAG: hypothetical protein EOP06_03840 [Pseudomonadota bacterium]